MNLQRTKTKRVLKSGTARLDPFPAGQCAACQILRFFPILVIKLLSMKGAQWVG